MTHRPRLWLSALGAAVGVVVAVPSPVDAQAFGWQVTVETDAVAEDHEIDVVGDATFLGGLGGATDADKVTLTLTQRTPLPPACGTGEPVVKEVDEVVDGRYEATISVSCNGPYRIEAIAHLGRATSVTPVVEDVGVEALPLPPPAPHSEGTATGIHVWWDPSPHPDAVGWVLHSAAPPQDFSVGQLETDLGPQYGGTTLAVEAVHWGVEGPTGPTVGSGPGRFTTAAQSNGNTISTDPPTDSTDPPNLTTTPGGGATVPSGTDPPTTSGPDLGTGSSQPLPDGFTEQLPFGTRPESFVPGSSPASDAPDDAEQAAGDPAPTGLVRTTQRTSPGLVAPFALALLMLTVAAHIAWYLRRSRPGGGPGQVRPV